MICPHCGDHILVLVMEETRVDVFSVCADGDGGLSYTDIDSEIIEPPASCYCPDCGMVVFNNLEEARPFLIHCSVVDNDGD